MTDPAPQPAARATPVFGEASCRASLSWGDLIACPRCALAKDKDDPSPLPCRARAISLSMIIDALAHQAQAIETGQVAAKHAGYRQFAHHGELERAQLLRAGAKLLALIKDDEVLRARLLTPKQKPETT
ncbi:hypothetical protein [Pseudorhodoplanes sp.]|uniref:hypothetical protein n=1 Tax=Pseudorhodoplanes sp. TaxID=1934341 RepID=UPI003D10AE59